MLNYELRAIINHHGDFVDRGHYTCYAKRYTQDSGEKWFHFDDENVVEMAEQPDMVDVSSESSVLIY